MWDDDIIFIDVKIWYRPKEIMIYDNFLVEYIGDAFVLLFGKWTTLLSIFIRFWNLGKHKEFVFIKDYWLLNMKFYPNCQNEKKNMLIHKNERKHNFYSTIPLTFPAL